MSMPRLRIFIIILAAAASVLVAVGVTQAAVNGHVASKHAKKVKHPKKVHSLRAPGLLTPADSAHVQQMPALTWSAVSGALEYQYEVAVDPHFHSLIVVSISAGKGIPSTHNLAASIEKPQIDGTYYWRVRAVSAAGRPGAWSATRSIVKAWTEQPQLQAPAEEAQITWPSTPLVLRWSEVPYALEYIVTIATDEKLSNIVLGTASSSVKTEGTAYSPIGTLQAGQTYYWAITPVDAEGHRGARSTIRKFTWSWPTTTATHVKRLNDPLGATELEWTPEFTWDPIPGAARYQVEVSSAAGFPAGSIWSNTTMIGTSYSPTVALNNNEYYWRVRAIDASGNAGVWNEGPGFIKTFDHQTPTISNLQMVDKKQNPTPVRPITETPIVTWSPVAGAGSYEVQIGRVEGTKYEISQPAQKTIKGDAISVKEPNDPVNEPEKPSFTITANLKEGSRIIEVTTGAEKLAPAHTGQKLSDKAGGIASGTAIAGLVDNLCGKIKTVDTASTAWTPLQSGGPIGQTNWPSSQNQTTPMTMGYSYCVSVAPISDKDIFGHLIEGAPTPIGHLAEGAFTYDTRFDRCERAHNFETEAAALETKGDSAEAGEEREDAEDIYNAYETLSPSECEETLEYPEPASYTPASAYKLPNPATPASRTPLFTWEPVLGATEYYVVIARNPQFTNVVDVAETYGNAYAPPIGNEEPLDDETTQYYWAVIPAKGGVHLGLTEENNPQSFNKSSTPPSPLAPAEGAEISGQPTFKWSPVSGETSEGARNYTVQVSTDPSFSNPIDNVTTDSTSYTSSSTYPAHQTLYWRVRANDADTGVHEGLDWSAVHTFKRSLATPQPATSNPTSGEAIPALEFTPITGAVGYMVRVEEPGGTTKEFSSRSPVFTATGWRGPGNWRFSERAEYPTAGGSTTVPGGYSAPISFTHTVAPPAHAVGIKLGNRIVISWNPQAYAKQYEVAISTNETFSTTIESHRVTQTSWAPSAVDLTKAANKGTLYWRVAAVDNNGNVGPYATGSFVPPKPKCVVRKVKRKKRTIKVCVASKHKPAKTKKKHG
jgi:hypothetical protein